MYLLLKLIHVLAVVVFVGNITAGAFWKAYADRTRDPDLIANAVAGIRRSDQVLTMPAVAVLVIAGFAAAGVGHIEILRTGWVLWSLILIIISGIAFMAGIVPLNRRLAALARAGAGSGSMDWTQYDALSRQWRVWGTLANVSPLIAIVLMVLKPQLLALH